MKLALTLLASLALFGCGDNQDNKPKLLTMGIIYTNTEGDKVSAPAYIIDNETKKHTMYICNKTLDGYGAGARNYYQTYKKVYVNNAVVEFEQVGTTCAYI